MYDGDDDDQLEVPRLTTRRRGVDFEGAVAAAKAAPAPLRAIWAVVLMMTGIATLFFWFLTTEVLAVEVTSTQWWFFLTSTAWLLCVALVWTFRSVMHAWVRAGAAVVGVGLVSTMVYIGERHAPMELGNLQFKLGLLVDNLDIPTFEGDGTFTYPGNSLDLEGALPMALDQSDCGSCWAFAAAGVISARYHIRQARESEDGRIPTREAQFVCPHRDVDASGWVVSPQALVEADRAAGFCPYVTGRCAGEPLTRGFNLARDNVVPNLACRPYYMRLGANSSCRSIGCQGIPGPTDEMVCSAEGGSAKHCILPIGERADTCVDGSPVKRKAVVRNVRRLVGEEAIIRELVENGPVGAYLTYYAKSDGTPSAWALASPSLSGRMYTKTVTAGYVARPYMDGNEYRDKPGGPGTIGHGVIIYGFGTTSSGVKYWRVRNSWGRFWGLRGNVRIERGVNAWGIETISVIAADVHAAEE